MKSVASRSSVSAEAPDRRRVRRVEHVEALGAEGALEHLGREARAAHPEQDEGVDLARRADLLDEALQVAEPAAHPHRLVQPAEPLRLVIAGPERRVTLPDPRDELGRARGRSRRLPQEREHELVELAGALHARHVRRRGDRLEPRARDLALEQLVRSPACPAGPRRRRSRASARRSRRAARRGRGRAAPPPRPRLRHLELERAPLHLADALAHGRIDVLGLAPRPVDPGAQVHLDRLVQVAGLERRLFLAPGVLRSPATSRGRAARAPTSTSAEYELGPGERDLEHDTAAERHAEERGALEAVVARASRSGRARSRSCPARAASGRSRAGRAGGRGRTRAYALPLRIPHAAVADPLVHERERRPFAGDLRVDRHAQRLRPRRARRAWPGRRPAAP